jgi:hypothetical protein
MDPITSVSPFFPTCAMCRTALGLVLVLLTASVARAQLVGYEGFDYSTGSGLNGLNGGLGWSTTPAGTWSTASPSFSISAGSLTPPAPADLLSTTGNRLTLSRTAPFTTAARTFGTDLRTLSGTSEVWISFVITRTASATTGSYGGLVIGNEAGSGSTSGRLFIGDSGATSPAADTWSLERAGGGVLGSSNFNVSTFPTVMLAARIQFQSGADSVQLYVNRPPGGGTPASVDAILSNLDINPSNGAVTDFGIWYGGDGGYQIDEIRIGLTYADVTPVPEPSLIIVTLGITLLGIRRFRR